MRRSGSSGTVASSIITEAPPFYAGIDPLNGLSAEDKVAMLKEADRIARSLDPSISQVSASLSALYEVVMVRASDGTLAADLRPLVRFNISVISSLLDFFGSTRMRQSHILSGYGQLIIVVYTV